MQRTRYKLLVLVSLSQSHTSVLFFIAASKRLLVHCSLQLLCSHAVSLSYGFKSSLCRLLILNLCSTIGIAQTLILTLHVQRVNNGVTLVNALEAVLRQQFSILAVFVHRAAFNTAILHHRTLRRNGTHNQSRELSLCVPRNTIVCHYLVVGSLHKLSVCVLIRLLALSFGCGLLGSHCPRCQTFLSRQRIVVYVISINGLRSFRRRRATKQLFLLLVGEGISAESCSLPVRSHKAFNVSRHHIKVTFLYAVLFLTLRQLGVCQLQRYNISASFKVALNAQPVCIVSLYRFGYITAHVHTYSLHGQLKSLGRNTLHSANVIDTCTYNAADTAHGSPARTFRQTAHSHKLNGIANRCVVTSRVVLYSRIRRAIQHASNALTHHSRTCHACYTATQSTVRNPRCLCHTITEYLASYGCTCLACCTKRRSVRNKAQCASCHSRGHTRIYIRVLPVVRHSHTLLSVLPLLLRCHSHRHDSAKHRLVYTTKNVFCSALRHTTAQLALVKVCCQFRLQSRYEAFFYILLWTKTVCSCLQSYFSLHLRL